MNYLKELSKKNKLDHYGHNDNNILLNTPNRNKEENKQNSNNNVISISLNKKLTFNNESSLKKSKFRNNNYDLNDISNSNRLQSKHGKVIIINGKNNLISNNNINNNNKRDKNEKNEKW